jgi:hypothetical protein
VEERKVWKQENAERYKCICGFKTSLKGDFTRHLARKTGDHADEKDFYATESDDE